MNGNFTPTILLNIPESEGIHVDQNKESEPNDNDSDDSCHNEQDQTDEETGNPWVESGAGSSTSYHITVHQHDLERVVASLNFDPFNKAVSK